MYLLMKRLKANIIKYGFLFHKKKIKNHNEINLVLIVMAKFQDGIWPLNSKLNQKNGREHHSFNRCRRFGSWENGCHPQICR